MENPPPVVAGAPPVKATVCPMAPVVIAVSVVAARNSAFGESTM
jgi:hypothetical protein